MVGHLHPPFPPPGHLSREYSYLASVRVIAISGTRSKIDNSQVEFQYRNPVIQPASSDHHSMATVQCANQSGLGIPVADVFFLGYQWVDHINCFCGHFIKTYFWCPIEFFTP